MTYRQSSAVNGIKSSRGLVFIKGKVKSKISKEKAFSSTKALQATKVFTKEV